MFIWRNMENYLLIVHVTPAFLEDCYMCIVKVMTILWCINGYDSLLLAF